MAHLLGDILVQQGYIDDSQLQTALLAQGSERGMLGAILLNRGWVTKTQLGEALSLQFEVPFLDLLTTSLNPQLVRLLPEKFARQRRVVPTTVSSGCMTLAMMAPDDIETICETELITGYSVEPVVATTSDITQSLDRGFDERVSARQTIVDMKITELHESATRTGDTEAVEQEDEDAPVVRLVKSILLGAVNAGASDIHLEPHDPEMRVRYRVDGVLQEVMTIPSHTEEAVVGRIKVMSDMDTTETRRPQDGNLTVEENSMRASYRVSTIPCVGGEKVCMRVLDENNRIFSFDMLGMPDHVVEQAKDLISRPHGMLVVTGPTGSGKTTTMYTMLTSIDASVKNISTVEDPVEFRLPGINQVQANNEHGMGFANALKFLMRQDPDVILVGEIRDHETATTAVQAALTGHLLISTLHTNDSIGCIARLGDLGLDNFKIGGSLLAAFAQRLLRKTCDQCKEPVKTNNKLLEKLIHEAGGIEIPANAQFYQGAGCSKCLGSGFTGRIPIYELFNVTPEVGAAIEAGLPSSKIRELATSQGMTELATNGVRQALEGKTTIEEVYFKLSG